MKIAVISDMHLGFKQKERENEALEQSIEAFNLALSFKPDLILIPGDIFDSDEPEQDTFIEAFNLFSLLKNTEKSNLKILKEGSKLNEFNGIPVIAINGTHEYRGKNQVNAVKLLEAANFLLHLHAEKALIEKGNERIAVFGLSGIPEKYAKDVLKAWNPKPEKNAFNILMFHQSLKEFLPFDDEMIASLSLSDFPDGFDLLLDGHFHSQTEIIQDKIHLIVPGSTIITQTKKIESEKPKGILLIDTSNKKIDFISLPKQRKFYFIELEFDEANTAKIVEAVTKELEKISSENLKPLVKIKIKGTLAKGLKKQDIDLSLIEEKFKEKLVLIFSIKLNDASFQKKIIELSKLQESKKSVKELGFELLEKNLKQTEFKNSFDARHLFELLSSDKTEEALKLLTES